MRTGASFMLIMRKASWSDFRLDAHNCRIWMTLSAMLVEFFVDGVNLRWCQMREHDVPTVKRLIALGAFPIEWNIGINVNSVEHEAWHFTSSLG
jgi:hypothetical protein